MKLMKRILLVGGCVLALFGYLAFVQYVIHAGKAIPENIKPASADQVDVRSTEQAMEMQLRAAPWQGLRFLSKEGEWRFYAVAGEQRQVDLIVPFNLVKIFYLEEDGNCPLPGRRWALRSQGKGMFRPAAVRSNPATWWR